MKIEETKIDLLKRALENGASVSASLTYADIPYSHYIECLKYYSLYYYAITEASLRKNLQADKGIKIYDEIEEDVEKYNKDKTFKAFVEECMLFIETINKAKAKYEIYLLTNIRDPKNRSQWNAYAWLLERLNPKDYGKNKVEENDDNKVQPVAPVKIEFISPDDEKSKKRIEEMEASIIESNKA